MSTPTRPTVFLSYSHQDEDWKDRVVKHLKVLDAELAWDDRQIAKGDAWLPEIQSAMDRATVALLLISPDFLTSTFICETEIPYLLKRRRDDGLRVIPLFVRPCAWQAVDWLTKIQGGPKDAKPLSEHRKSPAEKILANLALEIRDWLNDTRKESLREAPNGGAGIKPGVSTPGSATPTIPSPAGATASARGGNPGRAGDLPASLPGVETPGYIPAPPPGALPRLDLGRLPMAGPHLIGRETELNRLDAAWEDPRTHVLTFVAFGGMGKSALISHWLDRMSADGWRGARRALDWSFYSQGTEERVTSADRFLDHALTWFGDPDPKAGAPRDRGLRLAELVRQEKTLLILDGVEPLQQPPSHPLAGQLKDPGLAALLKGLAMANPGLCVVTTRDRISDLDRFPNTAPPKDLEALSPVAGAKLLKELGVKGKDSELLDASRKFGNHALTLTLLGNYLSRACAGDVRRQEDVDLSKADERQGGHALRVIGTYAKWLGESSELAVLRLLGLFDRPAGPKALAALRAKPTISRLTEPLMDLSEEDWQLALSNLREHGLLLPTDPYQPGTLDAHPLVRVFFQEELEKRRQEAWQAGNLRLYEHLQKEAPDLPETLEAMEPLLTSVIHGCRAGRYQDAFRNVYARRIQRGDKSFITRRLGAFGSDLSAISCFFVRRWDQPVADLNSEQQAFVLNEAGSCLRSLGRLTEAIRPLESALEIDIQRADQRSASVDAINLSELFLTLGNVEFAVFFGKESVDLADRSGDSTRRVMSRGTLADALHQPSRWEESAKVFRKAKALHEELLPRKIFSLLDYSHYSLLLSRSEPDDGSALDCLAADARAALRVRQACWKMRDQAERTLGSVTTAARDILSTALHHLTLGRAHLGLAMTSPDLQKVEADFTKATEHLDESIKKLRQASSEEFIARGLLARAALRRHRGDLLAAEADLTEAMEIAERGSMRLHECDAHLEWARLCRQREDRGGLKKHVARARELVEETGYGRRKREVEWLERQLSAMQNP